MKYKQFWQVTVRMDLYGILKMREESSLYANIFQVFLAVHKKTIMKENHKVGKKEISQYGNKI